jgi:hypothetical protein
MVLRASDIHAQGVDGTANELISIEPLVSKPSMGKRLQDDASRRKHDVEAPPMHDFGELGYDISLRASIAERNTTPYRCL